MYMSEKDFEYMYIDKLNGKKVALWGAGANLQKKREFIVKYICPELCVDSNEELWGNEILPGVICVSPKELDEKIDVVVITPEKRGIIHSIKNLIDEKFEIYTLNEIFDEVEIERQKKVDFGAESNLIKHFSCELGSCVCNINCSYCYIDFREEQFKYNAFFPHSISFMIKAVSKKRLGGPAFFNMCGMGETLLKPGAIELIYGLLSEGHYVGVITNGTVSAKIEELLRFEKQYKDRLLVQFSCHYLELKRQNMLDVYFDNVNKLRAGKISVAMTMPGADEYIPYIKEIKDTCMKKTGFLPVISPIREETNYENGFPLGSKYTWEKYCEIWEEFGSKAIVMRGKTLGKFTGLCYAGVNSGWLSFESGEIRTCVPGEHLDNIYEDITRKIKFKEECHLCNNGFCSHNNLFLSKRQDEKGTLLSWYENFVCIDQNGMPTYSEEIRKATDYCCDY